MGEQRSEQRAVARLSRRRFLQRAGVVSAGALAAYSVPGALSGARAGELPPTRAERLEGAFRPQLGAQSLGAGGRSEPLEAPFAFSLVGFELPDGAPVRFRTSVDGGVWSDWTTVEPLGALGEAPDDDADEAASGWRHMSPPVWVGEARWLQVEGAEAHRVVPHVIDSVGLSEPLAAQALGALLGGGLVGVAEAATADVPAWTGIPRIISRAEWGADEALRSGSPGYAAGLRFGVLHHTAGTNTYSNAEAAGVVRGIYRYHTQSLGWSDIGYNFLVDRYGRIYEGRAGGIDRPVIGAHAGGFNTGSVGVAIMGDFRAVAPPAAAEDAAVRVLSWKYRLHGVPTTGSVQVTSAGSARYPEGTVVTLPRLCGHRDTQATTCPGDVLYGRLGTLRRRLADTVTVANTTRDRTCRPGGNATAGPVERVAGGNRIRTAVAVSAAHWPTASSALIASARDFPDALAGAALAAREDAPLLLSEPDGFPQAVADELRRLRVARVALLGGSAALGPAVEEGVRRLGIPVERLAGENRFLTAAIIARRAGIGSRREVALALGEHPERARAWPDALAAGSLAALPDRAPVLLTLRNQLPRPTEQALADLGAATVLVVGGVTAVSDGVVARLRELGYGVRRLAGHDRYATAVEVARFARARRPEARTSLVVASGENFPDALTAGPVAARRGCPLLLVPACGLDPALATSAYLSLRDDYRTAVILGGTAAVSDRVRWQLNSVVG
jgi:putative cell wall-binding protein